MTGANSAPTVARLILTSDQDRHVIAFGCDDEFAAGTQDPLLIRWSDQENAVDWATSTVNTAGSIRISSGTEIITALQTKREIVIFTDASMHSMQYLGPPYTFGVQEISKSVQILGPNAVCAVADTLYWVSFGKFMMYDGAVREIPCTVEDYVFSDINTTQIEKIVAGHNLQFSEVWWFYPSSGSSENDRYVVYNYEQQLWYFGSMARTAWLPATVLTRPLATDANGNLFEHENGYNDGSTNPSSALNAYIESGSTDIEMGNSFFFANRIIPDITFRNSTGTPSATLTVKARRFPGAAIHTSYDTTTAQTATVPVETYTNQSHIRVRGRSLALRVESNELNTAWRLGTPRIEIRTDGRR